VDEQERDNSSRKQARRALNRVAIAVALLSTGFAAARAGAAEPPVKVDAPPQSAAAPVDRYPRVTLPDALGGQTDLQKLRGRQATVLISLSTECPISNGYIPTLNRLVDDYQDRGVRFVALNPNSGQSLRQMANQVQEYKARFPLLKDGGGRTVTGLGLAVCPEVCLLDAAGQIRYRGRIDDRYARRGGTARDLKDSDLARALDEVLAGKPVSHPETKAIGCPAQIIDHQAKQPAADSLEDAVTYSKQISRILQANCQECHRPTGIGPFSLMNYDEAHSWADDMRQFTADGTMPPWKPLDGYGEFRNHRGLSAEQKHDIARWVADGCPEGRAEERPEPRQFVEGWRLGEPDLVLSPKEDFHLDADGNDVYRCFVLPTHFDHDQYVVALEVLPGNPRVVHHVLAFLDTSGRALQLEAKGPGPGFTSPPGSPGFIPVGGIGGWAPGNVPEPLTGGMARTLPAGATVVMQVHYHKDGKPETDRTRLGLYFAKEKVTRAVRAVPVMPRGARASGMTIPANEKNYEVACSMTLPRDVLAVGISPHMHLLGRDMRVTATLPDGSVQQMLWLKDWDFNWQQMYRYRQPLELPTGTRIDMVAHFDNSDSNPRNPHRPPQTVRWGEQTTDEMCIAFVEMAPKAEARSADDLKLPSPATVAALLLRERFFGSQTAATGPGRPGERQEARRANEVRRAAARSVQPEERKPQQRMTPVQCGVAPVTASRASTASGGPEWGRRTHWVRHLMGRTP
jgi:peroxiredoxin/mono/diheme cytochrome c family protein